MESSGGMHGLKLVGVVDKSGHSHKIFARRYTIKHPPI